jgi:glycine betaine/proline transport system permease protein
LLVALLITIVLAIPIGIFASQNNRFSALIRPVLDTMQTLPAFVYFPLIIFLFRLGEVSGVIITVMYAIAPAIRLTELGIREVSAQVMESARSYGSTPKQLLLKVQLPLARRSIMLGINQTTMMAFAMITYASLIGAPGLGLDILKHTGRAQLGSAAETGICLVFLAIFFDRITQALAKK